MGMIHTRVLDVSGNRSVDVEVPDDIAVKRILVLLLERMNLPLHSPDGQLMSYKLHHRRSGRQLLDEQALGRRAYWWSVPERSATKSSRTLPCSAITGALASRSRS